MRRGPREAVRKRPSPETTQWLSMHANLARQVLQLEKEKARNGSAVGSRHHALRELQVELGALQDEDRQHDLARTQYARKVLRQLQGLKDTSRQMHRAVTHLMDESERAAAAQKAAETDARARGGVEGLTVPTEGIRAAAAREAEKSVQTAAEKLQRVMEKLQQDMATFKARMKGDYDQTATEERLLSRELLTMSDRFTAWQRTDKEAEEEDLDNVRRERIARKKQQQQARAGAGAGAARGSARSGRHASSDARARAEAQLQEGYMDAAHEGDVAGARGDLRGMGEQALRRQVEQLDALVEQDGGATGGWHPQEHEFFLAIWTKIAGVRTRPPPPPLQQQQESGDGSGADPPPLPPSSSSSSSRAAGAASEGRAAFALYPEEGTVEHRRWMAALRQRAVIGVPSRDAAEVEAHARWYMQHARRVALKKQILDEWRRRREVAALEARRRDQVALLAAERGLDYPEEILRGGGAGGGGGEEEEEEEEREFAQRAAAKARAAERAAEEAERKRRAVDEWREQKAAEKEAKAADEEAAKAAEEAERLQSRRRNRWKREQVALYKLEKEQRERHESEIRAVLLGGHKNNGGTAAAGAAGGGSRYNSSEMRARRDQDMENARARREAMREKGQAGARGEDLVALAKARGDALRQKVARDPNRALKGTAASQKRAMTQSELDDIEQTREGRKAHAAPVAMGAYDLKFGGRAVPSWRKGV